MNFGMDTYNFYFIEIRLIVGEGGIEIFPQHYRGYLKKSRFTKGETKKKKEKFVNFSSILPPPINNERSLTVRISLSGALAFELLKRFPMKCPVVLTKFILQILPLLSKF